MITFAAMIFLWGAAISGWFLAIYRGQEVARLQRRYGLLLKTYQERVRIHDKRS